MVSRRVLRRTAGTSLQYMLRHHAPSDFPFLLVPANVRLRTVFYATLCKLLFLDDSAIKFKTFVEPFTRLLRSLQARSFPEPSLNLP